MTVGTIAISIAGSGSGAGGTTNTSGVGAIANDYAELVSQGSNAFAASGAKIFHMEAGDLSLASPEQIGRIENGVTVTAAVVAQDQQLLDNIGAYCRANGISISVEAQLEDAPGQDWTDQWLAPAVQAALPITQVEGDDEIEFEHSVTNFGTVAANEAAVVAHIVHYLPGIAIGQWEGVGPTSTTQAWLTAYDSVAKADALPQISYLVEDTTWNAPWAVPPSVNQSWELALSTLAAQDHLSLSVLLDGTGTDTSGSAWVAQSEQNAASLARNTGAQVNDLQIQTWWAYPESVLPNNQDSTLSNDAEEIAATFSLYQAGLITAQATIAISAPPQDVIAVNALSSLSGVALQWDTADVADGANAAVVIVDETGLLSVTDSGNATVIGSGTNKLVIDGNAADLTAVLKSLKVIESGVAPDVIDIETFGANGRLADTQITVLSVSSPATAAGQTIALPTGGTGQTWTGATATVGGNGAISQLSFTWPTSNVNASGAYVVTQEIGIHAPLTEQGVAYVNGVIEAPAANVAGGATINLQGWSPAGDYDPAAATLTLSLTSTVMTYGSASGKLEQTTSTIAPYATGSNSSTAPLGNYLATGGQQVTEYNTGDNLNWNLDWNSMLASVTTTYGSSGQMLEQVFQGGSSEAWFSLDNIYNPNTGELWEQIQAAPPIGQYGSFASGPLFVTQFNTGNNPNWNYADWGTEAQVTTGWQDDCEVEVTTHAPVLTGAILTAAYNMTGGANLTPTTPGPSSTVTYAAGLTLFGGQNATSIITGGRSILYLPAVGPAVTVVSGGSDNIWVGATPTTITNNGATDTINAQGAQVQLNGTSFNLCGNANTVTLGVSATLNLSGGTDSVAFDSTGGTINLGNAGTVTVTGQPGQVNLTGTAAVATVGNNDSVNINGVGDVAAVGNGASVFVNADGASLHAGTTLQAWTTAANQLVSAGDHATVDETGSADTLSLGNYGTVWMNGTVETADLLGNSVVDIYGNGDVATIGSNGNLWIAGSDEHATAGDNSNAALVGNSDTLTAANKATIVVTGTLDTINLTGTSNLISSHASSSMIVNGSGSSVSVGPKASAAINGSNNTVTTASGDQIGLSGNGNTVTLGMSATLNLSDGTDSVAFGSTGDTINLGNAGTVTVTGQPGQVNLTGTAAVATIGDNDSVNINGVGDVATVAHNGSVFVNAVGATLHAGGALQAWTTGANQHVDAGDHATVDEIGRADSLSLGNYGIVWMNGNVETASVLGNGVVDIYGNGDVATAGSNSNLWIAGSNDHATVANKSKAAMVGNSDTLTAANKATIIVTGTLDTINLTGTANLISSHASTSMLVNGSDSSVSIGQNSSATICGSYNSVTAASGDQIVLSGSGHDTISFLGTGGSESIQGFSVANGDTLDLTQLLKGEHIATDLTNLAQYVGLQSRGADNILTVTGVAGQTHITLSGAGSMTLHGLETQHSLLFPS